MKKYNILVVILLSFFISNCGGTKENIFSINESSMKEQYTISDKIDLEILNPKNETIDSIVYSLNNKKIGSSKGQTKFNYIFKNEKLGYQSIKATVFYNGETEIDSSRVELVSNIQPKLLKYSIVNTYTHNTATFTEGLEFYNDTLYESAGQYGQSKLLKVDYKTGKILKSLDLEAKYFGEGITFLNDKIYQLTYKENIGFIYDAKTWKLIKTFPYDKLEGWGMTNDGKNIYFNDSSEKIWKMNPETLKTIDNINVYSSDTKIKQVNELEWIDGKIYSNIWLKDAIAVINPTTGAVEGILNMVDLRKSIKATKDDVLNGIAYNPKTKTIFVTGKNWDKLFEIKVTN